jgi:NAD(P) transhydrogenase subunit alpha
VPHHASQLYARNVANFVANLVKQGEMKIDLEDEIIRESLLTRDGELVHPRVREALRLAPRPA